MGLETVIKDVMDVAQATVSEINAEADAEASRIIEDAKQSAKEIKGKRLAKAEDEIQRMQRQELSSANLEVKRTMLNARKEVLEKAYNRAFDEIAGLSADKQESLLKNIIESHESKGSRIYSNKESEDIVKKLSSLEYAGNIDCIGGVVIENEDGSIRLDYTYEGILDSVYEQNLKQISDILFG
ncbi:V-type ATP synthase subunit E [Methanohalophilus mahii]|uniref:A-type ATP synthase subunit E n=1 Tax=Methanohalophilus mahii (strain ATCC 35705 / DSM 5219 / SLP) TaxID=547558 RepID=D5E707_METMS|nr:V-type ATP synthase subunit E [Methanohalophilus mahii]ADE36945.1 H+transporting two-sector ATPase E subunit [Methanohalophilus mahii DSM 5219]